MKKIIPGLLFLILLSYNACQNETPRETASRIHHKALTLDSHTDTPLRFTRDSFDIAVSHDARETYSRIDLPRMEQGDMDAVFLAAFIGQRERTPRGLQKAHAYTHSIIDSIEAQVSRNKDRVQIAYTPEDAYTNEKSGKRSFYIGIENGYALGHDLAAVKEFYERGVRYITLCHTSNNSLCDSSTDSAAHHGLSGFGRKVVRKMNQLGMMVDVSHISDASFYDVIELSQAPVIASHSNARGVCDHPRNLTDDMLQKMAENGGVVQVCLLSDYVKPPAEQPVRDSAFAALRKEYSGFKDLTEEERAQAVRKWHLLQKKYPQKLATVNDLVDHIDHIADVAGIDHVGIGSDFDGGGGLKDCFDISQMENITLELVKRGYTEEEIIKIWGGNFMRVFRKVQQLKNNA